LTAREVLIISKVKRHLFQGPNLNTNTAENVAINRAKMSGTLERQPLSLLLREHRGRCDVSREDSSVRKKNKKTPHFVAYFMNSICPCLIGFPETSLLRGIHFETYRPYRRMSVSI